MLCQSSCFEREKVCLFGSLIFSPACISASMAMTVYHASCKIKGGGCEKIMRLSSSTVRVPRANTMRSYICLSVPTDQFPTPSRLSRLVCLGNDWGYNRLGVNRVDRTKGLPGKTNIQAHEVRATAIKILHNAPHWRAESTGAKCKKCK